MKVSLGRYGQLGIVLAVSLVALVLIFTALQGGALRAAAALQSEPETLTVTLTATGIVIAETPTGEVFFNNTYPGVLTLTFTLTGTPPLTLTADPAFGVSSILTHTGTLPWVQVLTYTVAATETSYPYVQYQLTQSDVPTVTTTVLTFTQDIVAPVLGYGDPPITYTAETGLYADGAQLYYAAISEAPLSFTVQGVATDTLSGPGSITATAALSAAVPVGAWDQWGFTFALPVDFTAHDILTVTVADAVQNTAHLTFTYHHDSDPPVGTLRIISSTGYISSTFASLELSAHDGEGSGVGAMCLSNAATCTQWQPFTTTVTAWPLSAGDGEKTVSVWYRDQVGNTSAPIPATVIQDTTGPNLEYGDPPITLDSPSGLYADGPALYHLNTTGGNLFFSIQGTATDALAGPGSLSATAALVTPGNAGTWDDWRFTYRIPSGATASGIITVTATDLLQNTSLLTFTYTYDDAAPMGTLQIISHTGYISSTHTRLELTADDGAGSGVAQMCLSNTPICNDWQTFTMSVDTWELTANDGEKTVYVQYRDHLNNTSPVITATVYKDGTPPVVTVTAPSRVGDTAFEVSWAASDEGSGLGSEPQYTVYYCEDAGDWQPWFNGTTLTSSTFTSATLDHTYTFSVTVKDRAGNVGTGTATTRVDLYRVYIPLTIRDWVWWYAYDIYEPNDTPAGAWGPLESGKEYTAYIWDETDRNDYYHFTPSSNGPVTVNLTNIPVNTDYDLYVYYHDVDRYHLVAFSNQSNTREESVEFTGVAERTYYVRVYPYAGFSSQYPYTLKVVYP